MEGYPAEAARQAKNLARLEDSHPLDSQGVADSSKGFVPACPLGQIAKKTNLKIRRRDAPVVWAHRPDRVDCLVALAVSGQGVAQDRQAGLAQRPVHDLVHPADQEVCLVPLVDQDQEADRDCLPGPVDPAPRLARAGCLDPQAVQAGPEGPALADCRVLALDRRDVREAALDVAALTTMNSKMTKSNPCARAGCLDRQPGQVDCRVVARAQVGYLVGVGHRLAKAACQVADLDHQAVPADYLQRVRDHLLGQEGCPALGRVRAGYRVGPDRRLARAAYPAAERAPVVLEEMLKTKKRMSPCVRVVYPSVGLVLADYQVQKPVRRPDPADYLVGLGRLPVPVGCPARPAAFAPVGCQAVGLDRRPDLEEHLAHPAVFVQVDCPVAGQDRRPDLAGHLEQGQDRRLALVEYPVAERVRQDDQVARLALDLDRQFALVACLEPSRVHLPGLVDSRANRDLLAALVCRVARLECRAQAAYQPVRPAAQPSLKKAAGKLQGLPKRRLFHLIPNLTSWVSF